MYRKFAADQIFNGYEWLRDSVIITTPEGKVVELVKSSEAGDAIQHYEGLLCPGFINAHCHLELSHLKGAIPQHTGLVDFVQQVMGRRGATEALKLEAMLQAAEALYNSGTVAVGDICNTTGSIAVKTNSKLRWRNFIELSGFVEAGAGKRFNDGLLVKAAFDQSLPLMDNTVTPHAPYSVSRALFEMINAATAGKLISIHNQECAAEDELYLSKTGAFLNLYKNFGIDISSFTATGKTSLQSWGPYFDRQQTLLLVHDTFTGKEDMEWLKANQTTAYYCICIKANQYIENRIPPFELLRNSGAQMVIGTDSYASNTHLNMLEEIKTIQQETAYGIPLQEILTWATLNGAKALDMQEQLGSFEKGKTPGIVLIDAVDGLKLTGDSAARRLI